MEIHTMQWSLFCYNWVTAYIHLPTFKQVLIYILASPKQLLPLSTIYVWIMTHIRVIFA